MYVLVSVKVPIARAVGLQDRMKILVGDHQRSMEKIERQIKLARGDPKKLVMTRAALAVQGKRITMANMIRLGLEHGIGNITAMTNAQIFKLLLDEGVSRGRPRYARAS